MKTQPISETKQNPDCKGTDQLSRAGTALSPDPVSGPAGGGVGSLPLHENSIRSKTASVREWLTRIERDLDGGDVIHGFVVHSMGMEVTDLIYECGLYNSLVVVSERDHATSIA